MVHVIHQLLRSQQRWHNRHRGFTLLELLIAVSIMLILLAITATTLRITNEADRVRAGGRQLQSYLLGARDRAIYAKAPRGVRLLRGGTGAALTDPNDRANRLVTSMVYIEPTEPWAGSVAVLPMNTGAAWDTSSNQLRRVRLRDTDILPDWNQLQSRGLLTPGLRIQIPASNRGTWYLIQEVQIAGGNQDLIITTEYRQPSSTGVVYTRAQIELPASVAPNTEIVSLPRGVAIDLDRCGFPWVAESSGTWTQQNPNKIPFSIWMNGSNYNNRMDIMFSPRGTVTGAAAGMGVIHLYVTDTENLAGVPIGISVDDTAAGGFSYGQLWDPGYGSNPPSGLTVEAPIPDKVITSIFTRTGNVTCSPVNVFDTDADGIADDPFYFAERGEAAGR